MLHANIRRSDCVGLLFYAQIDPIQELSKYWYKATTQITRFHPKVHFFAYNTCSVSPCLAVQCFYGSIFCLPEIEDLRPKYPKQYNKKKH